MADDGLDITVPAAVDLSSYQYRFVAVDANGRGTVAAGVTTRILGVLQNKPAAAEVGARVRIAGKTKLQMNSAANENAAVTAEANGTGLGTATTTDQQQVGAVLLQASGGSADIVWALVRTFEKSGTD